MNNKIYLGDTVKDIHTGFVGIAMVYSKFFNGCEQYDVLPKVGKDNKPAESQGIDIQSLKVIKKGIKHLKVDKLISKSSSRKKSDLILDDNSGGPINKSKNMRGF